MDKRVFLPRLSPILSSSTSVVGRSWSYVMFYFLSSFFDEWNEVYAGAIPGEE
jgi:hypothetical protein